MDFRKIFYTKAEPLTEQLLQDVRAYLNAHFIPEYAAEEFHAEEFRVCETSRFNKLEECTGADGEFLYDTAPKLQAPAVGTARGAKSSRRLEDLLSQLGESFPQTLERMIRERGLKNSQVYRRANLTRQHFAKILNSEGYQPRKEAVLALAIALELNLDETRDFLGRAGYALTASSKTDVIVQFFIETENYDMFQLEQVLFQFTGRTLASY